MIINSYNPAGCSNDFECADDHACISHECQDPCLYENCGHNAYCKTKHHISRCYCNQGHKGDPYKLCSLYECLVDGDCPLVLACKQTRCIDPCDCAKNAECTPSNHRGHCTCLSGYTGDPYKLGCNKSKISEQVILTSAKHLFCYSCYSYCSSHWMSV